MTTSVGALTGSVLRSEEHVQTVDGEGDSHYSGTVPLDVDPAGSGFELRDRGRGGTYTIDVANKTDSALCSVDDLRHRPPPPSRPGSGRCRST